MKMNALLPKKKKRTSPLRTTEEKKLLQKRALRYMFPFEEEKWSEEEIRQQEIDLSHNREESIQQELPKVKNRKKFILDLLCTHKTTVRKGEFIICTKCGYSWKVKHDAGTSK